MAFFTFLCVLYMLSDLHAIYCIGRHPWWVPGGGAEGAPRDGEHQRDFPHGVGKEVCCGWKPEEFRWIVEGYLIPWLSRLDPQGYIKRMKELHKMFDRLLEHVLDEHVE